MRPPRQTLWRGTCSSQCRMISLDQSAPLLVRRRGWPGGGGGSSPTSRLPGWSWRRRGSTSILSRVWQCCVTAPAGQGRVRAPPGEGARSMERHQLPGSGAQLQGSHTGQQDGESRHSLVSWHLLRTVSAQHDGRDPPHHHPGLLLRPLQARQGWHVPRQ